jgi:hypothetical protein
MDKCECPLEDIQHVNRQHAPLKQQITNRVQHKCVRAGLKGTYIAKLGYGIGPMSLLPESALCGTGL